MGQLQSTFSSHVCFQKGRPDEESETWSPFIFITERQSALTLPVQSPSLCHILQHAREETLTNQKTDRFNFFCINKR